MRVGVVNDPNKGRFDGAIIDMSYTEDGHEAYTLIMKDGAAVALDASKIQALQENGFVSWDVPGGEALFGAPHAIDAKPQEMQVPDEPYAGDVAGRFETIWALLYNVPSIGAILFVAFASIGVFFASIASGGASIGEILSTYGAIIIIASGLLAAGAALLLKPFMIGETDIKEGVNER